MKRANFSTIHALGMKLVTLLVIALKVVFQSRNRFKRVNP